MSNLLQVDLAALPVDELKALAAVEEMLLFGSTPEIFRVQLQAQAARRRREKLTAYGFTVSQNMKTAGIMKAAEDNGIDLSAVPPGARVAELREALRLAVKARQDQIKAADEAVVAAEAAVEAARSKTPRLRQKRSVADLLAATVGFDDSFRGVAASATGFTKSAADDIMMVFTVEPPAVGQLVVLVRDAPASFGSAHIKGHGFDVFYLQEVLPDRLKAGFVEAVGGQDDEVIVVEACWPRLEHVLTLGGPTAARLRLEHNLDTKIPRTSPACAAGGGATDATSGASGGRRYTDEVTGGSLISFDKSNVAARLLSSRVYRRLASAEVRRRLIVDDMSFDSTRIWSEVQRLGRMYETHGARAAGSIPGIEYWRSVAELRMAPRGGSVIECLGQGGWGKRQGVTIMDFSEGVHGTGPNALKMALAAALGNFGHFLVLIAGKEYTGVMTGLQERVSIRDLADRDWMADYVVFEVDHLLEIFFMTLNSVSKLDFEEDHRGHSIDESPARVAVWLRSLFEELEPTHQRQYRFEKEKVMRESVPSGFQAPSYVKAGSLSVEGQRLPVQRPCRYHVLSELKVKNKKGVAFGACKKGVECTYAHPVMQTMPRAARETLLNDLFANDKGLLQKALSAGGQAT